MARLKTNEAITITLRLPRRAWPKELKPPAHHSIPAISLMRGRLTGRQAVMLIRVEGAIHEIQGALHFWECCGFMVGIADRNGIKNPLREPDNRKLPTLSTRSREPLPGLPRPLFRSSQTGIGELCI